MVQDYFNYARQQNLQSNYAKYIFIVTFYELLKKMVAYV
jgi:hypothetical protein